MNQALRLTSSLLRCQASENHLYTVASLSFQRPLSSSTEAKILDGKALAKTIEEEVSASIASLTASGRRAPHLTALIVGDDPASRTYVSNKIKACERSGITSDTIRFPVNVSEKTLLEKIAALNEDPSVDGILAQLPVPPHINERRVCNAVHPSKDVDGFNVLNVGRLACDHDALMPATALGVIELLRRHNIETFGKNAVVCGRSKNVGLPVAMMLHSDGDHEYPGLDATTTICHRYTPPEQLKVFTENADILVVAVGIPYLIKADMVKEGATVIDVGINVIDSEKGKRKLVGDVDFEGVLPKVAHITPVPGGVGPMTVAMLLKNTLKAAGKQVSYDF